MKKIILSFLTVISLTGSINAQGILDNSNYEYTNYADVQGCKFRMWVPPTSPKIKGVVVAFTQMQEIVGLDKNLREACMLEDLAIVWASQLGENDYPKLEAGLNKLAEVSGMPEIASAPFAVIAHSTAGIFCRTIASYNPERCFAIVQLSAVDYRDNEILKDVPWISIKNGLEETGDTWDEAVYFMVNDKQAYKAPDGSDSGDDKAWSSPRGNGCRISLISLPGGGHFGWSPFESRLVASFIEKAAHYQLSLDSPVIQRVPENQGWLTDTAIQEDASYAAAPYDNYEGDPSKAFWHIDEEMANLWSKMHAEEMAKLPQKVSQSTFDDNVWSNSSKKFDLRKNDVNSPYPTDASSDIAENPIKVKLYNGLFKVVDGKDLYYSPARYGFNGTKDWITFYQEGTSTHRYAEVTTGQVEATSFPSATDFTVTPISDVEINTPSVDYNVSGEVDNWVVSGNVYLENNKWVINSFTSVPKTQVYIRHAGGTHRNLKETSFTITNNRPNQTLAFSNSLPSAVENGKQSEVKLEAVSSSKDANISYYLVSGPAVLDSDKLTTTGETGTVKVMAVAQSQSENPAKALYSLEVKSGSTGIDIVNKENVKVYPTISEDVVNVENAPLNSFVYLYDINGRTLYKAKASAPNVVVPVANLNSGVYFVSIEGCKTTKIIRK